MLLPMLLPFPPHRGRGDSRAKGPRLRVARQ